MHPLEKVLLAMFAVMALQTIYLLEQSHHRHGMMRLRYVPLFLSVVILLWLGVRLIFNLAPWFGTI
jgi:hypothetical protein